MRRRWSSLFWFILAGLKQVMMFCNLEKKTKKCSGRPNAMRNTYFLKLPPIRFDAIWHLQLVYITGWNSAVINDMVLQTLQAMKMRDVTIKQHQEHYFWREVVLKYCKRSAQRNNIWNNKDSAFLRKVFFAISRKFDDTKFHFFQIWS